MHDESAPRSKARLTLKGRLEDLALCRPWVETLAAEHRIPAETQFAMDLCLEEAISNVIRHGYAGQADQPITVDFAVGSKGFSFTVEDHAPRFDPLSDKTAEEPPAASSIDEFSVGGLGILFMKKFANRIEYEALDGGNRLIIQFPQER